MANIPFLNNAYFSAKVGIGTETPGGKLDVKDGNSAMRFQEYSNGASLFLDGSNGDFVGGDYFNISAYGATDLAFGYGAVTKMVMKSSGNVGIGTTSPDRLLELSKSVQGGQGATLRLTNIVGGAGAGVAIEFNGPGSQGIHSKIKTEDLGAFDSNLIFQTKATASAGALADRLTIDNVGAIQFNDYGAGTLVTDSSGNITVSSGGGAGGPYLPLSAGSSYPLTGDLYINTPAGASQSGYALKLNKTNSSSQVQVGAEIFATPWASNTNGGTIIFKNADSATNLQETLRISANGSVGINSTSSSYKLDVGGNARFQDSVYINTSTGAGGLYVTRLGGASESLKISTTDSTSVFETFQDENTGSYGSMAFILDNGAPDPSYTFRYGSIVRFKIEGGTGDVILKDALLSNQKNTNVDTGTETVALVSTSIYTAAFFDFVIKKTTNVRSGTVYACHDGTSVVFTETSTNDLGDTSDVTLSVDISGTNMRLLATVTSDDWSVKSLIRAI